MLARLSCCVAVLLLAACGAALPGYTPPPFKEPGKLAKGLQSGDVAEGGEYQMSADEKAMDCRRTAGSMMITISRLKLRDSEVGTSAATVAANKAATPFLGGSAKGLDREAEYARERKKLLAYNQHLASKNCRTIDIEAELARPPEPAGKRY
jgi:hypothetical protein